MAKNCLAGTQKELQKWSIYNFPSHKEMELYFSVFQRGKEVKRLYRVLKGESDQYFIVVGHYEASLDVRTMTLRRKSSGILNQPLANNKIK